MLIEVERETSMVSQIPREGEKKEEKIMEAISLL